MPGMDLDGLRLHYELDGTDGPLVTLLGGLGNPLAAWTALTGRLISNGYTVLRIDTRGAGDSAGPPGPYDTQTLATDIDRAMEQLDVRATHLVGLSLGGMIAQHLAARHTDRFTSVTLACTYAVPGPYCERLFEHLDQLSHFGMEHVHTATVLHSFTPQFMSTQPEQFATIETQVHRNAQTVDAYRAQLAAARTHDSTSDLSSLTMPTLVLVARNDHLIPVEQSRQLYQALPNPTWGELPGGHGCLWEHPTEFADCLTKFLGSQR